MARKKATTQKETAFATANEPFEHLVSSTSVQDYLNAARTSALPVRLTYLAILLATATAFFPYWNALNTSWSNERIRSYRNALNWIGREPPCKQDDLGQCESYARAKSVFDSVGLSNVKDLKEVVSKTLNLLEETHNSDLRLVRLPVIGVTFDVNDLGLFSGFVFVVVMTMFRFSLWREFQNVERVYELAKDLDALTVHHPQRPHPPQPGIGPEVPLDSRRASAQMGTYYRRVCYEILSMGQLITTPWVGRTVEVYWQHAAKFGLWLPTLLQLAILANDISTLRTGFLLSPTNTVIVLMVSFASLLWIGFLTVQSYEVWKRLDSFWLREARVLKFIPLPDPLAGPYTP